MSHTHWSRAVFKALLEHTSQTRGGPHRQREMCTARHMSKYSHPEGAPLLSSTHGEKHLHGVSPQKNRGALYLASLLLALAATALVAIGLISASKEATPFSPDAQYDDRAVVIDVGQEVASSLSGSDTPSLRSYPGNQHGIEPKSGLGVHPASQSRRTKPERPTEREGYPSVLTEQRHGVQQGGGKGSDYGHVDKSGNSGGENGRSTAGGNGNVDAATGTKGDATRKPNVFYFMIDDMGWNDMGYQSTDLAALTPRMNMMAANGIKLTNYYSMQGCTPARSALMTGRYVMRTGMQYSVIQSGAPWGLPITEKLLPEYLNDAGYESHMVGKWHIGNFREELTPYRRGFKTYLGYLNGENYYWTHQNAGTTLDGRSFFDFGYGNETDYYNVMANVTLWEDNSSTTAGHSTERGGLTGVENARAKVKKDLSREAEAGVNVDDEGAMRYNQIYSEDAFLGRATRIVEATNPYAEKPLFLYVAHQSVHEPVPRTPRDGLSPEDQALLDSVESTELLRQEFAKSLLYLDKKVGEFMDTLDAAGWMENSIIVVTSDNGGCTTDGGNNYPLRGGKQSMFEGGFKVPAFIYSKSHIPKGLWGTEYDGLMHVSDWLPTLATAAGAEIKGSAGPLDGVDHWGAFSSSEGPRPGAYDVRSEMLYTWDSYSLSTSTVLTRNDSLAQGAYRQGKWKLLNNAWCSGYVSFDPAVQGDPLLDSFNVCKRNGVCNACVDTCTFNPEYQYKDWLFDLDADPRETTNLIHIYPEIADRLKKRAEEVVFSEYLPSGYQPINTLSYKLWASNGWWMSPWWKDLPAPPQP